MDPFYYSYTENVWGYKKRVDTFKRVIQDYSKTNSLTPHILDIGCGNGALVTIPLAALGFPILGIDPDIESVQRAQELNSHANCEFKALLSNEIDAAFDIVICSEVLEHVHDFVGLYEEIVRLLKPGGLAIITVPNGFGPFETERLIFERSGLLTLPRLLRDKIKGQHHQTDTSSTVNMDCGHVNFFTFGRIHTLLSSKLTVVKSINSTFLSGPVTNILLGRNTDFLAWNSKVSEALPRFLSSGWYFLCTKQS